LATTAEETCSAEYRDSFTNLYDSGGKYSGYAVDFFEPDSGDPLDEQAIGDALERITTDNLLRERLAKAGPTRARRFTWEQTALATLRALDFGT